MLRLKIATFLGAAIIGTVLIRFGVILLSMLLLPHLASAKRIAPVKVKPVVYEGIRYVAPNDDGRRGHVQGWNVTTNKKLWEMTVFNNRIDPSLEEDLQWVFIKKLNVQDGRLMVTSEHGNTHEIDLKTKAVTQSDPRASPSPGAMRDLPEAVKKVLTNGSLGKEYDVSVRIDPFYLEGDFNKDGKIDVAVLIKQRSTGKLGIAIVHGTTGKVTILAPALSSATVATTSSEWIPGRFLRRVPPTLQVKQVSHVSAATLFWWRRATPPAL